MINISEIISSEKLNQYLKNIELIDNKDYPFLTYVGLNFNHLEFTNIKFYFSFFKPLSEDEIKLLIPDFAINDFKMYYDQWIPTKKYQSLHRGVTFALKVSNIEKYNHYFHLRIPNFPFGFPQKNEKLDVNPFSGLAAEIHQQKINYKKYFYIENKNDIEYLFNEFNQKWAIKYLDQIEQIEYIESDLKDKIDIISNNQELIIEFFKRNASNILMSQIIEISERTNLKLFAPGTNKLNNEFSIYFIDYVATNKYIEFDGVKKFINHLNK